MKVMGQREVKKQESLKRILSTVREISREYQSQNKKLLPSTRDIADRCDLSIYNARHMLMQLQTEGVIAPVKGSNRRMLYWEAIKENR